MKINKRISIVCVLATLLLAAWPARAQYTLQNIGEYALIENNIGQLEKQYASQYKSRLSTIGYLGVITAEQERIRAWQKRYNNYLKDASRYASTIKATSTIVSEALTIFNELIDLKNAADANRQGIISTAAMNNLYMDVATDFVTVFNVFKQSLATGGNQNMLTGADRAVSLWKIQDTLDRLSLDLHKLCISIKYHNMLDVFNQSVSGFGALDKNSIARISHDRWKRASRLTQPND